MNKTATLPSKKRFVTVKNDKNLPCSSVEIGLQAHNECHDSIRPSKPFSHCGNVFVSLH